MRQEAEWWLRAGERDISSAVGLHRLSIFEGTAFHCQQAAEKLLKGLALARQSATLDGRVSPGREVGRGGREGGPGRDGPRPAPRAAAGYSG